MPDLEDKAPVDSPKLNRLADYGGAGILYCQAGLSVLLLLAGSQMFSFVSRGGVLNMSLNIHHPIYKFLQVIETEAAESDNEVAP